MPTLPAPPQGDFELPPAGTHHARCYRVVDLGTQQQIWDTGPERKHQIQISWELLSEMMEDGRPFTVHQWYTFSTFERAKLRQHLESWRGKAFQDSDFGPGGFDIAKLLGVPCLLSVIHSTNKKGNTRANVGGVMKPPKDTEFPALHNSTAILWLSKDEFDQAVFDGLSDWLKDTIRKSPEYAEIVSGHASDPQAPLGNEGQAGAATGDDWDSEIPF